jgi:hypothetical protein
LVPAPVVPATQEAEAGLFEPKGSRPAWTTEGEEGRKIGRDRGREGRRQGGRTDHKPLWILFS